MVKQWEKDILERQMKNESVAVGQLEKVYNKAHQDALEKLAMLKGMEPTPSVVRQVAFQEEITKQLSTVYDDLYKKSYTTIQGFLDTGAEDAFFGALYSMNKQGIPMAFPLPTEEIAQITRINPTTGFKLSEKLYANTTQLARKVKEEISRGLATDLSYQEMARNLKNASEANYKQAVRITRTEGHRVNGEVSFIAMDKAKKAGADIVKQWDSTLDKRTRKSHVEMDGQIRELEEKFVSGKGEKTMWQGGFGVANEDIHCRCVVLQRARWMLEADGEPPTKWDGVAKELVELKEKDYDGFKKAIKKLKKSPPIVPPVVPPIPDIHKVGKGENDAYGVKGLKKSERVSRRNFEGTEEEFQMARDAYRAKNAELTNIIEETVEKNLNRPLVYADENKIIEWVKSTGIELTDEVLDKVDVRAFEDIIPTMDEMFEKYPFLKKYDVTFDGETYSHTFRMDMYGSNDAIMSANGGLQFGSAYFEDYTRALQTGLDSFSSGFLVEGDGTFRTMIRHEVGHNMDNYIRFVKLGDKYDERGRTIVDNVRLRVQMDDELRKMVNLEGVSEYARTNTSEMFAEGFASYESGQVTEFSTEFAKFMDRWLNYAD